MVSGLLILNWFRHFGSAIQMETVWRHQNHKWIMLISVKQQTDWCFSWIKCISVKPLCNVHPYIHDCSTSVCAILQTSQQHPKPDVTFTSNSSQYVYWPQLLKRCASNKSSMFPDPNITFYGLLKMKHITWTPLGSPCDDTSTVLTCSFMISVVMVDAR